MKCPAPINALSAYERVCVNIFLFTKVSLFLWKRKYDESKLRILFFKKKNKKSFHSEFLTFLVDESSQIIM